MKVSNKLLAFLLILALLSIISSLILILGKLGAPTLLAGFVTFDTGVVNVTISATTDINLQEPANVDFGSSTLLAGTGNTSINTSDPAYGGTNPGTFAAPGPFTLRNDGNTELNISVNSSNTADTFIGGTQPGYYFTPSPVGTRDGCGGPSANNISAYNGSIYSFSTTAQQICENLTFSDTGGDQINISIFIDIPSDTSTGLKTDSGFEIHAVTLS